MRLANLAVPSVAVAVTVLLTSAGGTWGTAKEVPGSAALNKGEYADTFALSCAATGNCSTGGFYSDAAGHEQAFVAGETGGTWHTAKEIPGTAALNQGGEATIESMSCASAGDCSAGGLYTDAAGHQQAFVADETGGTWHTAKEDPGTAALNKGGYAATFSVSCASAGDCSAGGLYTDAAGHQQAFVADETGGTWHTAKEVPGTAALNTGGDAGVGSVSCASPGNCGAGGTYATTSTPYKAFVVSETGGVWHAAEEVRGTAASGKGEQAQTYSVSCASAGNCSAGGYYYFLASGTQQAFVVSEIHGTWGSAEKVPGTAAVNTGRDGVIDSVSCASAGNCSAGGDYVDASRHQQVFVVSQTGGTWGTAKEIPGSGALNTDGYADTTAVSCASAGNCSAGGTYKTTAGHSQPFIVDQTHGTWGTAEEVPGIAALNQARPAGLEAVSCAPAGGCSAGGFYTDVSGGQHAFIVSQTH